MDRKDSLAIELKDDTKQTAIEAIGLATYSNSQSTVLSYVSIFESLWTQTELYQKLKESEEVKDDFVHIAAHELRAPIQPILGLTQIVRWRIKDSHEQQLLDTVLRNAKRLQRLTQDILDISRIESKSLDLNKELFDLNDIILNAMDDLVLGTKFSSNNRLSMDDLVLGTKFSSNNRLSYEPHNILLHADKSRIAEVISNLLNNAVKFTPKGTITIDVKEHKTGDNNSNNRNRVIVSVKDAGQGIDVNILPKLFTKFASKSYHGTGLGLFISKGIVEAHGGKIWGENNPDGIGATFSFSLPLCQ